MSVVTRLRLNEVVGRHRDDLGGVASPVLGSKQGHRLHDLPVGHALDSPPKEHLHRWCGELLDSSATDPINPR